MASLVFSEEDLTACDIFSFCYWMNYTIKYNTSIDNTPIVKG